ncbi:MAG: prephenate dehydratase, partial [Cellvibrionaceae bacterium]
NWNYVFFIDFTGHQNDANVRAALTEVGERASDLKMLGSYPKAVL